MTRFPKSLRDERGMTFVMVGAGMLAFVSASILAIDVGMFMVARTQSQVAADAGALAGAVALAFDDFDDRTDTGPAKLNAIAAATSPVNGVMKTNVSVWPSDVTFPTTNRIRVRVQRSQVRGNPLATFLAPIIGIDSVNMGAIATAEAAPANAMTCVKPFTIPDKWIEKQTPPWDPDDSFDAFDKKGKPLADPDIYIPITDEVNYTGYDQVRDRGTLMVLKADNGSKIAPSFYYPYAVGESTGASDYEWNIANCNTTKMKFGEALVAEPGNMVGPTKSGMEDLILLDPTAEWDYAARKPKSTMHPSPRVVAIPVFDPVVYDGGKRSGRGADLRAVNYIGFFIEEMVGNEVKGRITPIGGLYTGSGGPAPAGAFPMAIVLVE